VWELVKQTLTEGCWDLKIVDGDLEHLPMSFDGLVSSRNWLAILIRSFSMAGKRITRSLIPTISQDAEDYRRIRTARISADHYVVEYQMRHKQGMVWYRERGLRRG
jgi:hypothetical protein